MSLYSVFHGWFWHPFGGKGYQFWSGIGSDFTELAVLGGVVAFLRRHNCHVRRCWRVQWHEVKMPDGRRFHVCRRHHPDGELGCPPPPTASAP